MLESSLTMIGILLIGHCGKNSMGFGRQPGKLVLRCWAVNGSLAGVGGHFGGSFRRVLCCQGSPYVEFDHTT